MTRTSEAQMNSWSIYIRNGKKERHRERKKKPNIFSYDQTREEKESKL
jgi:hypothetical protein